MKTKISEIYTAEIGVKEETGNNDGQRIEEYLQTCGLSKGNPWCAAFVTWVFLQAGIKALKTAVANNWFPEDKTVYVKGENPLYIPQKADVFGISYSNNGIINHIGLIDEWDENSDYFYSVEGNSSDKVSRNRRKKSEIYKISRWI